MRGYTIALMLPSLGLSAAYLEGYQTPHISEDQKTFDCGERFYDSRRLKAHRESFGRSPSELTASTAEAMQFSEIVATRYISKKVMYHEDLSTTMLYLMPIFHDTGCEPLNHPRRAAP
ncbi:CSEP0014 putative effector protein [Blumeria hordei DH14]|uniref:CSEP0014 putative effector protein n=1 Tax=Blumeria graminis f. sp. hordei (strain DH14) TaxID=546991 RepID=N1JGN5_BLUG1|nr:CSEP0014 putative effector protein [Blumeria hordei DH14]